MLKNDVLISVIVLYLCVYLISAQKTYKDFKRGFRRPNSNQTEDIRREQIFKKCFDQVTIHNKQKSDFTLAINEFSDWDDSELSKLLGLKVPASLRTGTDDYLSHLSLTQTSFAELQDERQTIPTDYDLRSHKCMPPVKNQGSCGSCWAFMAITPLEFAYCTKNNLVFSTSLLSEQQLVDCDSANNGCDGGWHTTAWNYLKGGSASQSAYPYIAKKTCCKYISSMLQAQVSSWTYVASKNAAAMQSALVKNGPLAVAMTVVNSFYNYASGVYTDSACDIRIVNHGVVIVGYGVLNGVDYWLARNSWGSTWGLKGYFMIQRGVNKCNIELFPAYVVAA